MDPVSNASNTTDDLFAGMKKKSKKSKKVDFGELEGAAPTPAPAAEPTPAPAAEEASASTDAPVADAGELDFSDLKKKRKKKSVRIASDDELEDDQPKQPAGRKTDAFGNEIVEEAPLPSAMASGGAAADGADEFADLKKKKKRSGKKANFDLEAFEKELAETESAEAEKAGSKSATPAGSDGEDDVEGDEPVEGEDPFGGEAEEGTQTKAEAAAEAKAWLKEGDRDYHYTEVRRVLLLLHFFMADPFPTAPRPLLLAPLRLPPFAFRRRQQEEVHHPPSPAFPRGQQAFHLCQRRRHLQEDAPSARARHPVPLCRVGHQWIRRWKWSFGHQGSLRAK